MNDSSLQQIHFELSKQLEIYILEILKMFGKYMKTETYFFLKNMYDYSKIIQIQDYGSINGMANDKHIYLPLTAKNVFENFKETPGYGMWKDHVLYDKDTLLVNNNTFFDYVFHVFISGYTLQDYYEDLLLHETLHFCGSGGSNALQEGINELLTRKVALKYNFRTNGCAYSKEVSLALRLEQLWGEDMLYKLAFAKTNEIPIILEKNIGKEAAILYANFLTLVEEEFQKVYYQHIDSYDGIKGIWKNCANYQKISYQKAYEYLETTSLIKKKK